MLGKAYGRVITSKTGVITLKNWKNISCVSMVERILALIRLGKVRVTKY
jgi:hypothetical protein